MDTEYQFKALGSCSALTVADAVRGCQYCELINWTPRDLCLWLELSAVPQKTLEALTHYGLPGMQFAKLCARDDMAGNASKTPVDYPMDNSGQADDLFAVNARLSWRNLAHARRGGPPLDKKEDAGPCTHGSLCQRDQQSL